MAQPVTLLDVPGARMGKHSAKRGTEHARPLVRTGPNQYRYETVQTRTWVNKPGSVNRDLKAPRASKNRGPGPLGVLPATSACDRRHHRRRR